MMVMFIEQIQLTRRGTRNVRIVKHARHRKDSGA